jgi:Transglutaminase-like superfamily
MRERLLELRDAVRAAWWTLRAVRSARGQLRRGVLDEVVLAPPPPLPHRAARGVAFVLSPLRPSCLERALVLQRWLAAHGLMHEVVVGVNKVGAQFTAHAWVDVEEPWQRGEFDEIARLGP